MHAAAPGPLVVFGRGVVSEVVAVATTGRVFPSPGLVFLPLRLLVPLLQTMPAWFAVSVVSGTAAPKGTGERLKSPFFKGGCPAGLFLGGRRRKTAPAVGERQRATHCEKLKRQSQELRLQEAVALQPAVPTPHSSGG